MATSSTCQGIGECRTWNQEIWVKFWINHLHSVTMGNLKRQRNLLFTFPDWHISQMLEPQTENLGTPLNPPCLRSVLSAPHQQPMNEYCWLHFHTRFWLCLFFPALLLLPFLGNHYIEFQSSDLSPVLFSILSMLFTAAILKCKSDGVTSPDCRAFPLQWE